MNVSELLRPMVDDAPPAPPLERIAARARRRRRVRRAAAAAVALVVLGIVGLAWDGRPQRTSPQRVVTAPTTPLPPAQPPDRLAFTRATPLFGPGLQHAEVVLVNDDGTHQVQLTHASADGLVASQPAWSPDRRRLAYIESTPAGAVNAGTGNVVVVDSDGTSHRRVTTGGTDTHPVWSPDGHQIAFARDDDGLMNIFEVNIDGSGLRQLTTSGAMSPTWSPDGTHIAYQDMPGGVPDGGHIFVMGADGAVPTQITHGAEETQPAWSPDGTRIAFQNTRDSSLYTVHPDGTAPTRIPTCSSQACSDISPAWSTDSARIVFVRSDGSRRQPYIVGSDGGDARPLLTDAADDCCFAWS
jgi:Tol biopolymer transport system component